MPWEENSDTPLVRRLTSKRALSSIIKEDVAHAASPLGLTRGLLVGVLALGEPLLQLLVVLLGIGLHLVCYVWFVALWLAFPVSVPLLYVYHRRQMLRNSLAERSYKQKQREASNGMWK